jgi:pilus assembly protein Flp/PilA
MERKEIEISKKEIQEEKNELGASLVEYALLVALVAVIAIGGMTFLGQKVSEQFSEIGDVIAP